MLKINDIDIETIEKEYEYNNSIFNEDSPQINRIKYIINHELNDIDKRILIIYAECSTYRSTAKKLNVSVGTIRNRIISIRKKILEKL